MQKFTDDRDRFDSDEIWFVEHPPVFTLGLNAEPRAFAIAGRYSGGANRPRRSGDLSRSGTVGDLSTHRFVASRLGVRELVVALENAVIAYVAELGVKAQGSREAPGVYVEGAKLASVGLRIRRRASYHGLALNVSLDLTPFERINVCGHRGLAVTRLADHSPRIADMGAAAAMSTVAQGLTPHLLRHLKFGTDEAPLDEEARDEGASYDRASTSDGASTRGRTGYNAISTDLQAVNSR